VKTSEIRNKAMHNNYVTKPFSEIYAGVSVDTSLFSGMWDEMLTKYSDLDWIW
jgi:hypothetical protein